MKYYQGPENIISNNMKTETITIVGGGTSAWLAAAFLQNNHPAIKITGVDKEGGNSIGV